MLMGIFGGKSSDDIKRSQVKLMRLRDQVENHRTNHNISINTALADREAAIRVIRDEILEIASMKD